MKRHNVLVFLNVNIAVICVITWHNEVWLTKSQMFWLLVIIYIYIYICMYVCIDGLWVQVAPGVTSQELHLL